MPTINETLAKLLLGPKTVKVTIFRPLNVKIKPIKCMKYNDIVWVTFITLSHNEIWEHDNQDLPLMHDYKHAQYSFTTHKEHWIPWPETYMLRIMHAIMFLLIFNFYSYFTFIFCWSMVKKIRHFFDVFSSCYFYNEITMTSCNKRNKSFWCFNLVRVIVMTSEKWPSQSVDEH